MSLWPEISKQISTTTGRPFQINTQRAVGGGCINEAYVIAGGQQRYFVKLNQAQRIEMFAAEAAALREMTETHSVKVPQPICWDVAGQQAYIVLEYLDLSGRAVQGYAALGAQLAAMHRVTQGRYGWQRNNTIGSTPQINTWQTDWVHFWREQRLEYQYRLAYTQGYRGRLQRSGTKVLESMEALFRRYTPAASLLHGDLWAGNMAIDNLGQPVIFDPASYYGDRETDIAMTELFGGVGPEFYRAYDEAYPLDEGYAIRKTLYNLYHVLNHLNLFGGGYLGQAEHMAEQLLSES